MHATEKNKDLVTVVALALQRQSDSKYLITRRGPGQSGSGEWEFPGGKLEKGETQKFGLAREIHEELSIRLNENDLNFLAEHVEHYPSKSVQIFLWKMVIDYTPDLILTEHDLFLWVTTEEIKHFSLSSGDKPFLMFL